MLLVSGLLKGLLIKHKEDFKYTIERRLSTTSRPTTHLKMLSLLVDEDFDGCIDLLSMDAFYDKQFEGVILCMNSFTGLPLEDVTEILDTWRLFSGGCP